MTRRGLLMSVALSGIAGYVDAIGFIDTGGLFVSFMSGNSTQVGVEVLDNGVLAAWLPVTLVGAFVVGVTAVAIIGGYGTRRARAVTVSAAAVGVSVILGILAPQEPWRFWALAFAMGGLNTLYLADGRARVAITYATGTLVSLGLAIATMVTGRGRSNWMRPLMLWGSLAAGAVLGAAAHQLGSGVALMGAVAALATVATCAFIGERRAVASR